MYRRFDESYCSECGSCTFARRKKRLRDLCKEELRIYHIVRNDVNKWNEIRTSTVALNNFDDLQLCGCDLRSADLTRLSMRSVCLRNSDLRGTKLTHSDLGGSDFSGAKIGVDWRTMQISDLADARLHAVNFSGVDLSQASGLNPTSFPGSDLRSANLPSIITPIEDKIKNICDYISETARGAGITFFGLLVLCVYTVLTIGGSISLMQSNDKIKVPIFDIEVPVTYMHFVLPLLIASMYVYMHLYLDRLWTALSGLPYRFPDGRFVHEKVYSSPLTGVVRLYFHRYSEQRIFTDRFEALSCIVLAWFAAPATLAFLSVHCSCTIRFQMICIITYGVTALTSFFGIHTFIQANKRLFSSVSTSR